MYTLPAALAHHADTIPDQLFTRIIKGDKVQTGVCSQSRTFAEAWQWASQWATVFVEAGVKKGDNVLIALPNCDAFAGAYFGVLMAGAVPAPIAPLRRLAEDDLYFVTVHQRLQFINAKALVVPYEHIGLADLAAFRHVAVLSERQAMSTHARVQDLGDPDGPGLIQFTSGTVGDPKAVVLSQQALIAQLDMLKRALRLYDRFQDWAVSWLPLFHDMGLVGFLLTPAYTGGAVHLLPTEDFILRPTLWLKALTETKATITGGPPSAYALCAKRIKGAEVGQYDLSSVRIALVGAEMVTAESLNAFAQKFAPAGFRSASLTPTYGLAETVLAVTMPPLDRGPRFDRVDSAALAEGEARPAETRLAEPDDSRLVTSVGPPLVGGAVAHEIAIMNEAGLPLPGRHVGEIVVRSPSLMSGYYADPLATEESLHDTWLWTGDVGYIADGELYITGRKKEVIIVGGRNYYPDDVEQAAGAVPGLRAGRVVAIGIPDAERATDKLIVLAEVDRGESTELKELRQRLREVLAAAGFPVSDVILLAPKSIQSTLTGKLKRLDCKARYLAGEFVNVY
jgi:acyl-CoA synthetase (AMP-forming)/AMP-acid ligase II